MKKMSVRNVKKCRIVTDKTEKTSSAESMNVSSPKVWIECVNLLRSLHSEVSSSIGYSKLRTKST